MKKFNQLKKYFVAGTVAIAASGTANAQVDLTAVEAELATMPASMAVIGGGLILAAVTAITYKWVKGALFG